MRRSSGDQMTGRRLPGGLKLLFQVLLLPGELLQPGARGLLVRPQLRGSVPGARGLGGPCPPVLLGLTNHHLLRGDVMAALASLLEQSQELRPPLLDRGGGYDLSASTFSPDGRVFQVEYAMKAVENSSTAIAVRCKDGVVFGVEKLVLSKLYEEGSNKRIFNVDRHVGMAVAGLLADARSLSEVAREEASNFRSNYGHNVPLKHLADRVAMYVHAYTLYSAVRPFGCSFILGSYDVDDGPQLYMVDPSGISYYDLSASTFSPDGRVFQVEYAMKAVENSSTAIAVRCKDGVVFGVEKLVLSKLYEEGSNKRIFNVDRHVGMAVAGLLADARSLSEVAREEASNFRSNYGHNVPLKHLADRVAMYVHAYTLYSAVRPFGCSIYIVHDEVKDKAFELDLSWDSLEEEDDSDDENIPTAQQQSPTAQQQSPTTQQKQSPTTQQGPTAQQQQQQSAMPEETGPQMDPEALVCHEVDLDDLDEKEKAPPPLPGNPLYQPPLPPPQPRLREDHPLEGAQDPPTLSPFEIKDRGQKRLMDADCSSSSKKAKRSQKAGEPAPRTQRNGTVLSPAAQSSDSEDPFVPERTKLCTPVKQTLSRAGRPTRSPQMPSPHKTYKWSFQLDELDRMSSSERVSFLQEKLQEIRSRGGGFWYNEQTWSDPVTCQPNDTSLTVWAAAAL
ncbi:hypothetical protein CRUP_023050 [Coryphaenoides rupestris]|nr:hypothetical protein CRUP_023050 [Coryphaenoides rupestris]